jgi:glycosyltransferase involved in cell wall biosynthesis
MISVIMAYYNQPQYIEEAIKSVLGQTYQNFEIIIANDSSSDLDLFDNLVKLDNRISYFCTDDVGGVKARTACINKSNYDYFVPLDPDDYIHPEFLEKTYHALSKRTNYGFCYTDSIFFTEESQQRMIQPDYNFYNLLQSNYICYCSLIKKKAWFDSGGYNEGNFNFYEDYEAWIRLGRKAHFGFHIAEPLFYYRMHKNGMTGKTKDFGNYYKAFIIRWYPELYPPYWQEEVDKILKDVPSNFMSLKPKQQEEIINKIKGKSV